MLQKYEPISPHTLEEANRRINSCVRKRDATSRAIVALTYQNEIDWLLTEIEVIKEVDGRDE